MLPGEDGDALLELGEIVARGAEALEDVPPCLLVLHVTNRVAAHAHEATEPSSLHAVHRSRVRRGALWGEVVTPSRYAPTPEANVCSEGGVLRWLGERGHRTHGRRRDRERLDELGDRVQAVEVLVGSAGAVLASLRDDPNCPRLEELEVLIAAAGAVLREVGRPTASSVARPDS